jgi:hypothetical protein
MRTCRSKIERRRGSKGFAVFGLILGGLLGELRKYLDFFLSSQQAAQKKNIGFLILLIGALGRFFRKFMKINFFKL